MIDAHGEMVRQWWQADCRCPADLLAASMLSQIEALGHAKTMRSLPERMPEGAPQPAPEVPRTPPPQEADDQMIMGLQYLQTSGDTRR